MQVAVWAGVLLAAIPKGAFSQDDAARQVVVTDRDGRAFEGRLTHLADGQLTLGGPRPQRLATHSLISLKRRQRPTATAGTDPLVLLTGGDVFAARAGAGDDEALSARWTRQPTWKPLPVPLEALRGIIVSRSEDPAALARIWNRIEQHRERHDLVLLSNGDTLTGEFAGLSEQNLTLKTAAGESRIDLFGVRAVAFNPELTNVEKLSGEGALISLVDGSGFRVRNLKLGLLGRLECRTLFGAELELPLETVEAVRFLGGCATYLSDLEPAEYRFHPFLELSWPLRRDRTVQGGPLRLRGTACAKGLGMHSASDVTYRLNGRYRRFQATIGIDDDAEGAGSAVFEVLVDGKSVFRSESLTGASQPVVLDKIDLTLARSLTLRVEFADRGDIQDHADWCDALLIN